MMSVCGRIRAIERIMIMKRRSLAMIACILFLFACGAQADLLSAASAAVSVPDADACFAGATSKRDKVDVEGLPKGDGTLYMNVTAQQIEDFRSQAFALGFAESGSAQGDQWESEILECGGAHIAIVSYPSLTPMRVIIVYEEGFEYTSISAAPAPTSSILDNFADEIDGDYIRLNVNGQTFIMTMGGGELYDGSNWVPSSRSDAPELRDYVSTWCLDSGSILAVFGDGTDSIAIGFPLEVKSSSVVDPDTGRTALLFYDCQSALSEFDRGVWQTSSSYSATSYGVQVTPAGTSYAFTITEIDADKTYCSGTFTGELLNNMNIGSADTLSVTGDFRFAIAH